MQANRCKDGKPIMPILKIRNSTHTRRTYLPIWELNNSARCWQKMRHTSSTSRSTIFEFLAVTMAELSLQGRMIVTVTNGSLSYTEKHTTCKQNCQITNFKAINPTVSSIGWSKQSTNWNEISYKHIFYVGMGGDIYIKKNSFGEHEAIKEEIFLTTKQIKTKQ